DRRRVEIAGGVRDAQAAAEVHLLDRELRTRRGELGDETGHDGRSQRVRAEIHDLRTDVAVEPGKVHRVALRRARRGVERIAGGDGEAELRVVRSGRDVVVRERGHAGRDTQQHAWARHAVRDERLDPVELVVTVDHNRARAELECEPQLELRLV